MDARGSAVRDQAPPVGGGHGLPLTRTVGREDDLAKIVRLLDDGHTRLLTLTGPGGVGKTRLAFEVLNRLAPDFANGGVFVSLESITDPERVPAAVAQACDVPGSGGLQPDAALLAALQPRHQLLVLDNFEHLLEPAPIWLSDVLTRCPTIQVLVTSRVPLSMTGESRFPVAPLALPDVGRDDLAAESPAVALMLDRARAVRLDFPSDEQTMAQLARICRHLDGLPLAIELAAPRLATLSPSDLLTRLERRLDALGPGPRDAPLRHRSLTATIAWSYDLLARDQRDLLRRLSVFRGGFSLDAAEAVCGPPLGPIDDVWGGIAALVDQSLVQSLYTNAGGSRFQMLETVREFAGRELEGHGQARATSDAHAMWCQHAAEAVSQGKTSHEQAWAIHALAIDHDNVLAALEWLYASAQGDRLYRLTHALAAYWNFGGLGLTGLHWYRRALAQAPGPAQERLPALLMMGVLANSNNEPDADTLIAEGMQLAVACGTPEQVADATVNLGLRAEDSGDFPAAAIHFCAARARYEQTGNQWSAILCDYHQGVVALGLGDPDRAAELLEEARATALANEDPFLPVWALNYLVMIACVRNDLDGALRLLRLHPPTHAVGYQQRRLLTRTAAAAVASLRGDHEAVVRLIAPIDHGVSLGEPELGIARQSLERAHVALGAARYGRASALGLNLSLVDLDAELARLVEATPDHPREHSAPDHGLSGREREVLRLLAEGKSNAEIADALFISIRTAANHVSNILAKLDLGSRTAAVAFAVRHDLV
jgi:predicted ATPase/DNA-binding CsgD family transcriptional regulator